MKEPWNLIWCMKRVSTELSEAFYPAVPPPSQWRLVAGGFWPQWLSSYLLKSAGKTNTGLNQHPADMWVYSSRHQRSDSSSVDEGRRATRLKQQKWENIMTESHFRQMASRYIYQPAPAGLWASQTLSSSFTSVCFLFVICVFLFNASSSFLSFLPVSLFPSLYSSFHLLLSIFNEHF